VSAFSLFIHFGVLFNGAYLNVGIFKKRNVIHNYG